MKKIIFAFLITALISVPCYAGIKIDSFSAIDGTAWTAADRDDLDFAFFNGELYVNCTWMGVSEPGCENGELLPIDSVIRETGRIGFSIHFSLPNSTQIYRFEVVDLEDNTGAMDLWHITLWPLRPNPLFLISPELIDEDKFFGLGIYRHYTYDSRWDKESPTFFVQSR